MKVYFYCHTCFHAIRQHIGEPGFELPTHTTQSLTDAINNHVMQGHEVHIEYVESEEVA